MNKILSSLTSASFIVYLLWQIQVGTLQLVQVSTKSDQCLCPGDVVVYECTVFGEEGEVATTVWRGGAFHCKTSANEITLLSKRLSSSENVSQSCNNGDIIGRSVEVENTSYGINHTSQLLVTLTSDLVTSWIECVDDNGLNEALVGSLNITAELCPIPTKYNISWKSDCPESSLFFNWSQAHSQCSPVRYYVTTSNCGSCPNTTTQNNITCTDAPIDGSMCNLTIQAEVHENVKQQLSIQPTCLIIQDENRSSSSVATIVSVVVLSLLVVILLTVLTVIFRKSILKFIAQSGQKSNAFLSSIRIPRSTAREEDRSSEIENEYYCRDAVTVKVFDNASNGMYGLEEFAGYDQPKTQDTRSTERVLELDGLLMSLQGQVSSHWYRFGLALGVPEEFMKQLADYSEKDALVELLDYWLKNHPGRPTWEEVDVALKIINCTSVTNGFVEIQSSALVFY